jgi:lipopolysaccharide export system permease protein
MIGATILMILSFVLNHFIVPRSSKVRLAFEEKYYRDVLSVEDYQAEYPGNEMVYFSNYTSSENQIHDLTIQKWNDENEPIYFFRARTVKSIPGTNRWSVKDYYEKNYEFPKGRLVHGSKKDTTFSFTLEEIAQRENVAETMTFSELTRLIDREKVKGSALVPTYQIELHQRTSYPFAAYILTIMGVSVSSRKKRGGIGVNVAVGLAIVFVYIFSMKMLTVASMNVGLPAIISVWIPNIMFAFAAYILYRFSQK